MTTEKIVSLYRVLSDCKLTKVGDQDKYVIIKILRKLRPTAESFEVFQKDAEEKLKPENWEEWVYCIIKRGDLCNGNRKLVQFFHANPDMIHMKKELMVPVANQIPHGNKNYWLNTDWYNNWRKCKKDTKFKE